MIILRHCNGLLKTAIQTSKYTTVKMSAKPDILQEINDEDLPTLRDMYKNDWPRLLEPYLFINNYIQWKQKNPATKVEFLCPNGKWDDGTFIAIAKEGIQNMFMYTLDKSCDRLATGLENTEKIDWKKGLFTYSLHESFANKICPILQNIGQPIIVHHQLFMWHIDKQIALNFNPICPDDCYFDTLTPDHATVISANWIMKVPGLEDYIRNILIMNQSQGLFAKADGELRCSALITDMGYPGFLQVAEKYKKMGYARNMFEYCTKVLAQDTELIVQTLKSHHFMSAFYKKIGAKIINSSHMFLFKATN